MEITPRFWHGQGNSPYPQKVNVPVALVAFTKTIFGLSGTAGSSSVSDSASTS